MTFHDILSDADGWAHHINGVRNDLFPSRFMALEAARRSAERDMLKGLGVAVRYQTADGAMRPIHSNSLPGTGAALGGAANR